MHKFALFFMLAVTASVAVILSEPVFAQETTGDDTSADTTSEQTSTEDSTGDQTTDETMGEEMAADTTSMEMTTMTSHTDSPLKQMSMGVDPHQIQCVAGHKLVFRANTWQPACVKESSFETLSAWGWVANHDPSNDELAGMLADHMTKYPMITEPEHQTDIEESMDVKDDSSSTNDTSTDQPAPQSHSIELSESMDMGAQ